MDNTSQPGLVRIFLNLLGLVALAAPFIFFFHLEFRPAPAPGEIEETTALMSFISIPVLTSPLIFLSAICIRFVNRAYGPNFWMYWFICTGFAIIPGLIFSLHSANSYFVVMTWMLGGALVSMAYWAKFYQLSRRKL